MISTVPILVRRCKTINPLVWTIGGYALLLFILSSIRHNLFRSGALDLGYHDQALYLISQGEPPVISFWGNHFLGGHGEWIYYGLAWLYRINADVHWLLAIQAIALAITLWPLWQLAIQAGLSPYQCWTVAISYLLYPLVFNVNLFDFHPEVMAVPLILTSVLTARDRRPLGFAIATTLILGCRASLSLLVVSMGIWLIFWEQRRWYGVYAFISGSTWFLLFTQILVPTFKPDGYHALGRYGALGDSITAVGLNVFLKPGVVLQQLFTLSNLGYLVLLTLPFLWGISWRHLAPLIGSLPILGMNLLTDYWPQKDLVHQYSVPILPFLLLVVIGTLAAQKNWLKKRRWILIWCLVCFAALGKYTKFTGSYLNSLDTWSATHQAIAQVDTRGGVLTTHAVIPHLTHRTLIHLTTEASLEVDLTQYEFVLLNLHHPGTGSSPELAQQLLNRLKAADNFTLIFDQDEIYLFRQHV